MVHTVDDGSEEPKLRPVIDMTLPPVVGWLYGKVADVAGASYENNPSLVDADDSSVIVTSTELESPAGAPATHAHVYTDGSHGHIFGGSHCNMCRTGVITITGTALAIGVTRQHAHASLFTSVRICRSMCMSHLYRMSCLRALARACTHMQRPHPRIGSKTT